MKVQKKPVIIDAVKWDGSNFEEVASFAGHTKISVDANLNTLKVTTNEGVMDGVVGCYILKATSASISEHVWPVDEGYFDENYTIIPEEA